MLDQEVVKFDAQYVSTFLSNKFCHTCVGGIITVVESKQLFIGYLANLIFSFWYLLVMS